MSDRYRIGLIVPSSNTTMETELPELFRRRELDQPERFSFHSARMRMTEVTPEALAAMDAQSGRCAVELADAECDVLAYACLVAIMANRAAADSAHASAAQRLSNAASARRPIPAVTSAGALCKALLAIGASSVALIAPYLPPLTQRVIGYLGNQGIEVVDSISLGVADNCAVGRLDPWQLPTLARQLNLTRAEAIVLSACVQMPSLPAIPEVERWSGLPVLSAATATAWQLLTTIHLDPAIPDAGSLLQTARTRSSI